jgi:putative protein-disulfide isomerase
MVRLYYVHDPMCSWCWAFRPAWRAIAQGLPEGIETRRVLGGLAPDTDRPMPEPMQRYLQQTWRLIQSRVPGTRFDFEFWSRCVPRRSTYPACRAVIAAMRQAAAFEEAMILAIQRAYYLGAANPSDEDTLVRLAANIGLDPDRFGHDLYAVETRDELAGQMAFARRIGARGYPSLVLETETCYRVLTHDYNVPQVVLEQLRTWA